MYLTGHIKHDMNSGSVAIRTTFPEVPQLMNMAWIVATTNVGPRNTSTEEVDSWDDLFDPSGSV